MNSRTTAGFRSAFSLLPSQIQQRARVAYRRFRQDPHHPSLQCKIVHTTRPIYSARVGLGYRVLGLREGDTLVWFWIGSHAEYDRLLHQLRGGG